MKLFTIEYTYETCLHRGESTTIVLSSSKDKAIELLKERFKSIKEILTIKESEIDESFSYVVEFI